MIESIALRRARRMWGASARVVDRGPGYRLPVAERSALLQEVDRIERARPRNAEVLLAELRARLASPERYQVGYDDWKAGFDVFVVMGQGASYEEAFAQAERRQASVDRSRTLAVLTRRPR